MQEMQAFCQVPSLLEMQRHLCAQSWCPKLGGAAQTCVPQCQINALEPLDADLAE
eukprot:CAMPEP_0202390030 /NCGR_PEP_ID=MMETSP1127-20130417/86392_1 /ASSEMBLY_ACC=CAM_ASM_000462 /TAXON_ID=3047 /ORGANISM="Dunaliella tertiolecta, Strain CCMP1320" /LENGTH=54 /DNA_ID=CAMNT_0048992035 /DNA_START=35 /DNA_END=196 /DNA_ORIENTATION=-